MTLQQNINGVLHFFRQFLSRRNVDMLTALKQYSQAPRKRAMQQACNSLSVFEAKCCIMDFKDALSDALHAAAERGHLALVHAIVRRVNSDSLFEILSTIDTATSAPLHQAAFNGHLEIVTCLLDALKPHQQYELVLRPLRSNQLALHLAARSNNDGIISEMLNRLNPKQQQEALIANAGGTAVDIAREANNQEAVACLERFMRSSAEQLRNATASNDENEQLGQRVRIVEGRMEDIQEQFDESNSRMDLHNQRLEELWQFGVSP